MIRRFLSDETGSTLPLFAMLGATISILLAGILVNGTYFVEDRRLQSLADLIALLAVREDDYSIEFARVIIADQGLDPTQYAPILTPGRYVADLERNPEDRFEAGQRPHNAVHVELFRLSALHHTAGQPAGQERRLVAEAAAARLDRVSFSVGSRLLRAEGGLAESATRALLGGRASLNLMDYEALAHLNLDAPALLGRLASQRSRVMTYEDVLETDWSRAEWLDAISGELAQHDTRLSGLVSRLYLPAGRVRGRDLIETDLTGPMSGTGSGLTVTALALLESLALNLGGDHQVETVLETDLANLSLWIGEAPQHGSLALSGQGRSVAETRALHLEATSLPLLSGTTLDLSAATAVAELVNLQCQASGRVRADFLVTTSPAQLRIESTGRLSQGRSTAIDLGDGERVRVSLTQDHIRRKEPVTVGSGLGLQSGLTGSLSLSPVNDLLETVGVHIAEADLFLHDAQCGHPFLIR